MIAECGELHADFFCDPGGFFRRRNAQDVELRLAKLAYEDGCRRSGTQANDHAVADLAKGSESRLPVEIGIHTKRLTRSSSASSTMCSSYPQSESCSRSRVVSDTTSVSHIDDPIVVSDCRARALFEIGLPKYPETLIRTVGPSVSSFA